MKAHVAEQKKTIVDHIITFLSKYRVPLLVLVIVVGVAIAAMFVAIAVRDNRIERSLLAVETLQDEFDAWASTDLAQREERFPALADRIDGVASDYSGTYAAARAQMIRAEALLALERFADAATAFESVAPETPDSYLAPIAIMRAAVAREEGGDDEAALLSLVSVVDQYPDSSVAARALFSVGRLNESLGRVADAADAYNRLVEDYPASNWTNLARNRIITLTVEGRIGG